MSDSIIETVTLLLFVGAILLGFGSISYFFFFFSCYKKYSDYQPEYTLFGGCRIELNGENDTS